MRLRASRLFPALVLTVGIGVGPVLRVPPAVAEKVISPERQAFIDKADAICLKSALRMEKPLRAYETHKIEGFGARGSWRADPKGVAKYVAKVAATEIGGQIRALRLLQPPADDVKDVRAMLDTAQKELDALVKNGARAAYSEPFEKSAKAMQQYGFAVCGSSERPADRSDSDK